jgi:hypothetical protein
MRKLGLQLTTFSASDYNKDSQYMAENIWSRWVRFKCTVQNYLEEDDYSEITEVDAGIYNSLEPDLDKVTPTTNDPISVANPREGIRLDRKE